MRAIRAFFLRLGGLFLKERRDRDLAEEIESHLLLHVEDNLQAGMNAEDARREALLKFGGIESIKEQYRDRRSLPLLESLAQDLRYALRVLRKNPGFTTVAVLTLALGIGANTAMYSIVHAVMLRPLPVPNAENLVRIYETHPSRGLLTFSASIPNYHSWQHQANSLELGAFISVPRNLTGDGEPQRLEAIAATSSFLTIMGTSLQLGRWFIEEEERPGQHRVAVLSDGFWKRRFGRDSNAVGRELLVDGEPYTIVGVARPDLTIPSAPDLWVPLLARPFFDDPNANRGNHFITVIARLRPGFTLPQAQAEMLSIARELERQFPESNKGWSIAVVPLLHWLIPQEIRTALVLLLGAVGIVMLIACANVANLLLARAESRRREMAIRAALGAGAARIARQLLTESLLLSIAGGALGVALGGGIVRVARRSLVEIVPRAADVVIDLNVLGFALGVSVITGLLFGVAPLAQLGKMRSLDALHQAGRTSQPATRSHLRALLVIGQVSLATLLLVGAGLLIQSLARMQQVSLGIEPDPVLTARIPLPSGKYWRAAAYSALLSRLTDALRSAPGVSAAGVSSAIPLGPGSHTMGKAAAIAPSDTSLAQPINCDWRSADAGFFAALRIPVLRGRLFGRENVPDGRRVFVLSQEAARSLYGAEDPVGRQLRVNDAVGEVIGVVGDVRMKNITDPPARVVYLPLEQAGFFGVFTVFVRTGDRPEAAAALIRERLREIDPNVPAYGFRPMRDWVENSSARARIRTWVLALLAGVALALGMIGIYGVLAYLVTLRRHEFGVRLALGARPGNLLRLVLVQGLGLALIGVATGLAGSLLLTRILDTLLFGVGARDPMTFLGVAMLLLLSALIACYVPARRAARADPIAALRME
ncbi:MAG TPA: ABC transporter permease [Candidatus Acidoferrales bacterium]|jgi:predicted permease|nr:ABC transporter permease [Candidatus Acidoferrales bacterium]